MKYTDNVLNILTLKTFKGIGNAWIVKHLQQDKTADELVELINTKTKQDEFVTLLSFQNIKTYIKDSFKNLHNTDGIVAFGDKDFPKYRGNVNAGEQPVVLFYKGDITLLKRDNKNISVIGLLKPSIEVEEYERMVVKELVFRNVTVVSGLALGCDSIAHVQTLQSGGKTVAILPSTLEKINPFSNKNLAQSIVISGGLLISEYHEEAKSKREFINRYIQRDRLQALFSDGIILSASYRANNMGLDSGSRHAMNYALKYGIKRSVIYDDVIHQNNPMYDLNRDIIYADKTVMSIDKNNIKEMLDRLLSVRITQEFDFN